MACVLMLGFKSFDAAQATLIGIELMHMLRKGPLEGGADMEKGDQGKGDQEK